MKYTLWQAEIAQVEPTMTMLATGHSRPTRTKWFSAKNPLEHIPGDDGWPIVGNTLKVLRDPVGAVEAMHAKHGPVFRSRVFGFRGVSLLGPEANELVLFDREKNFSSAGGWGMILDQVFPRGLMLMDFDEHRLHRKALGIAFKPAPMKAYLGALNDGIARRIAEWHLTGDGQGGAADLQFYPAIKQLTLDLASTSFLGIELGPQADTIYRAFVDMLAASIGIVRSPVPGTAMWRGVKGREVIVDFFSSEIPKRRHGQATDLFSELCRATKEDGSLLSTQEIADHMSFLMLAAHDTLTSSVTSLVYMLAKNPQWQDRLRAEMRGLNLPTGAPLPYDRLGELELTEMAFKEAMRINPPVPSIPRQAVPRRLERWHTSRGQIANFVACQLSLSPPDFGEEIYTARLGTFKSRNARRAVSIEFAETVWLLLGDTRVELSELLKVDGGHIRLDHEELRILAHQSADGRTGGKRYQPSRTRQRHLAQLTELRNIRLQEVADRLKRANPTWKKHTIAAAIIESGEFAEFKTQATVERIIRVPRNLRRKNFA
jgi:cytochrome P450